MTWIMNLIWLLPMAMMLLAEIERIETQSQAWPLALSFVAILITALPDIHTFPLLLPLNPAWLRWHYVFAELLLFAVLLLYWRTIPPATATTK